MEPLRFLTSQTIAIAKQAKRKGLAIFRVCVTAICLANVSCHSTGVEQDHVGQVQMLIVSLPTWGRMGVDEVTNTKEIQDLLKQISRFETDTIRKAMSQYLEQAKRQTTSAIPDVEWKWKLFLLNRYLFNVPDEIWPNLPANVGWSVGDTRNRSLRWPFTEITPEGNIKLATAAFAYTGQTYFPIDEFDFFNGQFGRRVIAQ